MSPKVKRAYRLASAIVAFASELLPDAWEAREQADELKHALADYLSDGEYSAPPFSAFVPGALTSEAVEVLDGIDVKEGVS